MNNNLLLGAVFVLVFSTGLFIGRYARAHDGYSDWTMPNNPTLSCCHDTDCRVTRAYVGDDGFWRAYVRGEWISIPFAALLPTDKAGGGRSHICERDGRVYCFSPGPPKS